MFSLSFDYKILARNPKRFVVLDKNCFVFTEQTDNVFHGLIFPFSFIVENAQPKSE